MVLLLMGHSCCWFLCFHGDDDDNDGDGDDEVEQRHCSQDNHVSCWSLCDSHCRDKEVQKQAIVQAQQTATVAQALP